MSFLIVEKIINEWKKQGFYELNQDALWSWVIEFLYYTICDFPAEFKRKYSEQILNLIQKYEVREYLIAESQQGHLAEIKEWALNDLTVEDELKTLAEKTEREKYEIDETLKSKAFKLGTKLTRKKDRIIL